MIWHSLSNSSIMGHDGNLIFDLWWKTKRAFPRQILILITLKIDLPVYLRPAVLNYRFLLYFQPNQMDNEGDMILVGDVPWQHDNKYNGPIFHWSLLIKTLINSTLLFNFMFHDIWSICMLWCNCRGSVALCRRFYLHFWRGLMLQRRYIGQQRWTHFRF